MLTSLFPIEQMTAAEREREDAMREGVDIKGCVMPLEVAQGRRRARTRPAHVQMHDEGQRADARSRAREFEIECDMIISAIGQMADLVDGLETLDSGRGAIARRRRLQGPQAGQAFRRRRRRSARIC